MGGPIDMNTMIDQAYSLFNTAWPLIGLIGGLVMAFSGMKIMGRMVSLMGVMDGPADPAPASHYDIDYSDDYEDEEEIEEEPDPEPEVRAIRCKWCNHTRLPLGPCPHCGGSE